MPTDQQILSEEQIAEIEARANAATKGPWRHFYPAARDFAHYGVIRPPNFIEEQDGVTVDAAPASGIRYQVEGLGKVNGADRGAIAYTSEPKSRNTSFSVDPKERALKLAHRQCERDGEFMAHAREDVPALCQTVRALQGQYDSAVSDFAVEINRVNQQLSEVEKERERLLGLIDTPHTDSWLRAVPLEAAHQIKRWGVEHDVGKTPWDWFWLIGYLAQKAAGSALAGDTEKAKHHTISTGAVLLNWFRRLAGDETMFQPGIDPTQHGAAATLSDAAQRLPQEMIHKLENLDHQGD